MAQSKGKVLVTGASGFIASHLILDLLAQGYEVRGTVRHLQRAESLRANLLQHSDLAADLEFVEAQLTDVECWHQAVKGCDGIFHLASPVPTIQPKSPDELIAQSRGGVENVIGAANAEGIKRIIVTSTISALLDTQRVKGRVYTATDWADPSDKKLTPYALSKTLAEKAAWELAEKYDLDLTTINPGMVFGPALEADYGASLEVINKLLTGAVPMTPRIGYDIVDVRDVAILHRLAFEDESSVGQRLLCGAGFRWFSEIADLLRSELPAYAGIIPRNEMPVIMTRIFALFTRELFSFLNDLDSVRSMDCTPAIELGWKPRSPEEAIMDGAKSLIELDVL